MARSANHNQSARGFAGGYAVLLILATCMFLVVLSMISQAAGWPG
jgi:hypothetical protein